MVNDLRSDILQSSGHDLDALQTHPDTVYALDAQFRLIYFNAAWERFASANGAGPSFAADWPLGRSLFDAIPEAIAGFYTSALSDCLQAGTVWHHDYECSSPGHFRRFHQTVYPLSDGEGLLVVNSLLIERPHEDAEAVPGSGEVDAYLDEHGTLHQCCHCRRIQSQEDAERWDWVPALVAEQVYPTSHGLCAICLDHYYPAPEDP